MFWLLLRAGKEAELADHFEARDIGERRADLEIFFAGESQVGQAESEVLAGRQAILGVQVAAGGGELEGAGRAQVQVGIALGDRRPVPGSRG